MDAGMGAGRVHYKGLMADSARWDAFVHRPGDIVISTPPKCGTTWLQMICGLLVFQTPVFDRPLDVISPWLDMLTRDLDSVLGDLDAQQHRRFVKTHTPLDGLPYRDDVSYLCVGRDPRDVAISWDNHVANNDAVTMFTARFNAVGLDDIMDKLAQGPPVRPEAEVDRFWEWVDDPAPVTEVFSLAATMHHLSTFWAARDRPNVVLVRYEDLLADLDGEMRRLADRLGIAVDDERWPALVGAAGFERMRARADEVVPEVTSAIWFDNRRFFNAGTSGQWRRFLDDAGVARYRERVRALADPDLVDWLHHGTLT